jgi:hypothetical protein
MHCILLLISLRNCNISQAATTDQTLHYCCVGDDGINLINA